MCMHVFDVGVGQSPLVIIITTYNWLVGRCVGGGGGAGGGGLFDAEAWSCGTTVFMLHQYIALLSQYIELVRQYIEPYSIYI